MESTPPIKRLQIDGTVTLKRKSQWVTRYAKIVDCIFTYKNQKTDRNDKARIDLRNAKIMLGQRDPAQNLAPYIYIQENPLKPEAIRISFEDETVLQRWLEVVQQSRKTDEQLRDLILKGQTNPALKGAGESKKSIGFSEAQADTDRATLDHKGREGLEFSSPMKRSKTIKSKAEYELFNNNLTKISAQAEMDEILGAILEKKFEYLTREWILKSNIDTINVYVDNKDVPLSPPGQFVDVKRAVKVANDQGQTQLKNALSLSSKRSETIISCLMASMFLLQTKSLPFGISNSIGDEALARYMYLLSVGVIALSIHNYLQSTRFSTAQSFKNLTEADFKGPEVEHKGPFKLRCQTFLIASPDELLKYLLDPTLRLLWDYNVKNAKINDKKELVVNYNSSNPGSSAALMEKTTFKYMVDGSKFYIIENAFAPILGKYHRVWILEQVQNRPYFMRVNYLAEMKAQYCNIRDGGRDLVRSFGALKNLIQSSDRMQEMPILIQMVKEFQDSANDEQQNQETRVQQIRTNLNNNNLINEAIELIEEDQYDPNISHTVLSDDDEQINSSSKKPSEILKADVPPPVVYKEDNTLPEVQWDWESITDWQTRIAAYTQEQKEFYNAIVPKIQELKGVMASTNSWDLLVDSKKDDIFIETKKSIRGFLIVRAQGHIDWSAKDIFRCVMYNPLKNQWDINCDKTVYRKKVGVNGYVLYNKTVKKYVVAARDFVMNWIQNTEPDGSTYYCASSVGCKYDEPAVKDVIRGATPLSGFHIKPTPGNPNRCKITIVNEVDLKISIPDFVLRQILKDQGYQIDRLRKMLPIWKKKFPGESPN